MRFTFLKYAASFILSLSVFLIINSFNSVYAAGCAGADLDPNDANINSRDYNINASICKNNEKWYCYDEWWWGNDYWTKDSTCPVACNNGDLSKPDTQASCSGCTYNAKSYKEGSTFCVPNAGFGHTIYKCNPNQQQIPTSTNCPLSQPGDIATCMDTYDAATKSGSASCVTPTPKPPDATKQCLYNGQVLLGNESICAANVVVTCDRTNAQCDSDGICLFDCAAGASGQVCSQNGKHASCGNPSPTPTRVLTPTPPPAAGVKCFHPDYPNDDTKKIDAGQQICTDKNWSFGHLVYRCNNEGIAEKLGSCKIGGCTFSSDPAPVGQDACAASYFVPLDANASCQIDPNLGQINPQVGLNCGIPEEEPVLMEDGSGNFIYKEDKTHSFHRCCYSNQNNLNQALSCLADPNLPGIDTLKDWFFGFVWSIVDRLPAIWDDGPYAFNIGNLRDVSTQISGCRSDSGPKDNKKPGDVDCFCKLTNGTESKVDQLCVNSPPNEKNACLDCVRPSKNGGQGGVWSGIGCVVIESESGFVNRVLGIGVSLGGAMSFLCLMYGAFLFQTSRGSPDSLKKARELITSCLTGLLMIIFAIFILQLIGYTILRIPGFSGP